MQTIEIDGNQVDVYESLYEYVKGADIGDYVLEYGINEVSPHDDPEWFGTYDKLPEAVQKYADEHNLTGVNWGETETSLIPEDEFYGSVFVLGLSDGSWDGGNGFFEDRDAAEKVHQENIDEEIQDLLKDLREHGIPEDRIQDLMEDEGENVFICGECGRVLEGDYDLLSDGRIYFTCPEYAENPHLDHTSFSIDFQQDRVPQSFEIKGFEILEKTVKAQGTSGRVYVPPDWIGRRVAIVRLD